MGQPLSQHMLAHDVMGTVRAVTDPVTAGIELSANGDLILVAQQYLVSPSGDTSGVTDSAAINVAVGLAVAAGNAVVHFAEGQYYVSSPIELTNATGVVLFGGAGAARIKLADNQAAAVPGDMVNIIEISGCTRCGVVGMSLDGNYQNQNMANLAMSFGDLAQGGSGNRRDPFTVRYVGAGAAASLNIAGNVLTTTCTGATGDNLSIDLTAAGYDTVAELVTHINALTAYEATALHATFGTQQSSRLYATTIADIKTAAVGVNFANASNAVTHEIYGNNVYIINSKECIVADCDLSNAPHMGVMITGNSSRNLVTRNTGSYNNWRACEIWPNAGTASTANLVTNNIFKNSYHDSIVAEFPGTYRNVIEANSVYLDDFAFNDGAFDGIVIYNSIGNVVKGNVLTGCRLRVFTGTPNYNSIIGNTVDGLNRHATLDYRLHGIWIAEGVGNIVQGNSLNDTYYNGIHVSAAASKSLIKNNVVVNLSAGGVNPVPIYITAGSADNVLDDNMLVDNALGLTDLGTRTILNGVGQNGSFDPASGGAWTANGVEGVTVQWDNGAGKKRLSQYSGGAWINYYVEP